MKIIILTLFYLISILFYIIFLYPDNKENYSNEGIQNMYSMFKNKEYTSNDIINFNKNFLLKNNLIFPTGSVIMYNNNNIPEGWALCNGTNGTPDLRGFFIKGWGKDKLKYKKNNLNKNITQKHLPSHYKITDIYTENYIHDFPINYFIINKSNDTFYTTTGYGLYDKEKKIFISPPYYKLNYIIKL